MLKFVRTKTVSHMRPLATPIPSSVPTQLHLVGTSPRQPSLRRQRLAHRPQMQTYENVPHLNGNYSFMINYLFKLPLGENDCCLPLPSERTKAAVTHG